jgi:hypothetical protein
MLSYVAGRYALSGIVEYSPFLSSSSSEEPTYCGFERERPWERRIVSVFYTPQFGDPFCFHYLGLLHVQIAPVDLGVRVQVIKVFVLERRRAQKKELVRLWC